MLESSDGQGSAEFGVKWEQWGLTDWSRLARQGFNSVILV